MIKQVNVKLEADVVEVAALLVKIVDVAKNKGDVAALLPNLITAIEGIGTVPASWEEDKACVIGSFLFEVTKVLDVIVKK